MKRITQICLSLLLLIGAGQLFGQVQLGRQVIGSTGGYSTSANLMLSSTVGEAVVQSLFSVSYILTQGFQQPEGVQDSILGDSLIFYRGITPNGDDKNDKWVIKNIERFPENRVQIFNRWGDNIWSRDNYDNNEVVWEGNADNGNRLADGTYFYVATIDDQIFKGWVELTR